MLKSALEGIQGLGDKSIERLFKKFKSMEGICSATEEDLASEIGKARARLIRENFAKTE